VSRSKKITFGLIAICSLIILCAGIVNSLMSMLEG
jgi:hypothetical protein